MADEQRVCQGERKAGGPCGARPVRQGTVIAGHVLSGKYCRAHDPALPDSARFGSRAQARVASLIGGGRPPMPKPTDVARKLIEDHVYAILRPHFRSLGLELNDDGSTTRLERGAIVTGESKNGEVIASTIEDLGAQIAAAEKLLDRVYGRPRQAVEMSGSVDVDHTGLEGLSDAELLKRLAAETAHGG